MHKGMIVDDASIVRMRLRDILGPYFEIVSEAGNGADALVNYKVSKPDFITLDISMPGMDGIETLKKLLEYDPEAKVVIISAVGQKKQVFEALSIGAKDFIVKPFDAERVKEAVSSLFSDDD